MDIYRDYSEPVPPHHHYPYRYPDPVFMDIYNFFACEAWFYDEMWYWEAE